MNKNHKSFFNLRTFFLSTKTLLKRSVSPYYFFSKKAFKILKLCYNNRTNVRKDNCDCNFGKVLGVGDDAMDQIVMHIDVNSAFLSWTAAYEKQMGIERDIRTVPAVIGGNEQSRHGIVLAKSTPAKNSRYKQECLLWKQGKCVLICL